jgi:predicted nucleic acid-binding protein
MGITMSTYYLDSNLYISVLSKDRVSALVVELFSKAESKKVQLTSSALVYGEVLNAGSAANHNDVVQFLDVLPVTYAPLDKLIMVQAAKLRIENTALKLPDAIHLATAIIGQCDMFLSEDKQLVKMAKKYIAGESVLSVVHK